MKTNTKQLLQHQLFKTSRFSTEKDLDKNKGPGQKQIAHQFTRKGGVHFDSNVRPP